jgi:hypothetical protein
MGEARRRRFALVKGGRADVAKIAYAKPSELIEEKFLATKELTAAIDERFEHVNKESCPTRADFLNALVVAGLRSFDAYARTREKAEEQQESLIALPTPGEVIKLG